MAHMVPFNWEDPFDLETQLTEDERMIRDAAHGFAQSELQPRVQQAFRDEADAPELFPLFGQAGLLGARAFFAEEISARIAFGASSLAETRNRSISRFTRARVRRSRPTST